MPNSLRDQLRASPEFAGRLARLSDIELEALFFDWRFWARPDQLVPDDCACHHGNWATWLVLAGRGFGKTRTGAETVRQWWRQGFDRINFIGPTSDDVRDAMVEGESGILAVCPRSERPIYRVSKRRLEWPNGALSLLFSAEEPERLRGKQQEKLWCFIAGTEISVPGVSAPIEKLRKGDTVLTRFGLQPVSRVLSHPEFVGRVRFSDGSELIGTEEHPVLTFNGWTTLKSLSAGQSVLKATSSLTSAPSAREKRLPSINTDGYGKRPTDQFREASTFTTSTETGRTTTSLTCCSSLPKSTAPFTRQNGSERVSLPASDMRSPAKDATANSLSKAGHVTLCADHAGHAKPTIRGELSDRAATVDEYSSPSMDVFAVSVVSTWEPVGIRRVYNLTVDKVHEYIANGVIVHNCDEPAAWRYAQDCWDMAMFGLRLGKNPQTVATTTPKPTKLIKSILSDAATHVTRGTTYDNRSNLAPGFYKHIITKYEGTRLGRQEINAELLEDNPGALFKIEDIDSARVRHRREYRRIVVALDPAVTSDEDSDEWGIIVAGELDQEDKSKPQQFDVLEDLSAIYTPDEAAKKAVILYHQYEADRIIGEANNGGDMIEALLRHQDGNVAYTKVTASRGKRIRAEPVSALYEQRRVHHVGILGKLEDELTDWNPEVDTTSPNRLDAMVWAITALASTKGDGFTAYYSRKAKKQEPAKEAPVQGGNTVALPKDARNWSLPIKFIQIETKADGVTKEMWDGGFGRELQDWITFCQKNGGGTRLAFAQKEYARLEKKFGTLAVEVG